MYVCNLYLMSLRFLDGFPVPEVHVLLKSVSFVIVLARFQQTPDRSHSACAEIAEQGKRHNSHYIRLCAHHPVKTSQL